jgi:hypothetical protein
MQTLAKDIRIKDFEIPNEVHPAMKSVYPTHCQYSSNSEHRQH